ncbi:MAG: DUF2173 family protein [Thiobacillus sp.]|nr:DUF2173 family protein [Thiobacillus sp.]
MQATGWTRLTGQKGFCPSAGQLDQVDTPLAAELCHANGRITHHKSWMMMGDELSICAVAEVACFVRNREVSLKDVFRSLTALSHK